MDFDTFAEWAIGIALTSLFVLFLVFCIKEKRVTDYYLRTPERGAGVCVYVDITWDVDSLVYCTDKKEDALDFLTKAKATLK